MPAAWKVTSISDTSDFSNDAAGPIPAKRIDFQMMNGHKAYIVVVDSEFDPNTIMDKVHEMATKIADVLTLEGPDVEHLSQMSNYAPQ